MRNIYILSHVYQQLFRNTPVPPPESGGVLGGTSGVITRFESDDGVEADSVHYQPDARWLNATLQVWKKQGLCFYGLYHTHAFGGGLSASDKRYINDVVKAVCENGEFLYFPILYSDISMTAFKAERKGESVVITQEPIMLIK